ncbi:phosphotransferase enzyme family protein [Nocardia testacea]|uniref:phosphotransferase enzyme family protein n=1 Tax=Nocardia testacea TaxID=248551 RepID=UPI0033D07384
MPRSSAFLPEAVDATMQQACRAAALDPCGSTLMRLGENMLYQLSSAPVVVRIGRNLQHLDDARKEVAVADWLASQGFPAARTYEIGMDQPLVVNGHPVTFWQFLPGRPANVDEAGMLGSLLRKLHHLAPPAVDLPPVEAFGHVLNRLIAAPIPSAHKDVLQAQVIDLESSLETLDFRLTPAAIHGDAHVKNVMVSEAGATLIDLEAFGWGPAEWDLAKTAAETSMGMIGKRDYAAFVEAYGYDVTEWSGWPIMQGIQQVKMVSWLAQNVEHSPEIRAEYEKRIDTIRTGVLSEPWRGF